MKYLLVGIFLTVNFFAHSQEVSDNPQQNSRNYKAQNSRASQVGSRPILVSKKAEGRNYKKTKFQNADSMSFTSIVLTPEQSLKSRNYKK